MVRPEGDGSACRDPFSFVHVLRVFASLDPELIAVKPSASLDLWSFSSFWSFRLVGELRFSVDLGEREVAFDSPRFQPGPLETINNFGMLG